MEKYIELALRTEPSTEKYLESIERINNTQMIRLLHAFIGLETEVGEILDALKKHVFYGKELDVVNLAEELGDLDWYKAIATDALATLLERDPYELETSIKKTNIEKLKARFPNKFNNTDAVERNLENERKILESN